MNQEKKKSKAKIWLVSLAIFSVLFVLPGLGWYYLQRGLDYQLEVRADIQKYGIAPVLPEAALFYGNWPDTLGEKLYITAFVDLADEPTAQIFAEKMGGFLQQFEVSNTILLTTYTPNTIDSSALYTFLQDHSLLNADHHLIFRLQPNEYANLLATYEQTVPEHKKGAQPLLVMVDDSLYIRNYYDLRKDGEINHLIQQVAIMAPRGEEPSIIFEREKEK